MINKLQMKEKNVNSMCNTSKVITPLTIDIPKNNSNDKIKELRRPRSRAYIENLVELQELLIQVNKERVKQKVKSSNSKNQKYSNDSLSGLGVTTYDNSNHDTNSTSYKLYDEINSCDNKNIEINNNMSHGLNHEIDNEVNIEQESSMINFYLNRIDTMTQQPIVSVDLHMSYEETQEEEENPIINDLERRIQEKLKALEEENPYIKELLCLLYPRDKEEYLMSCGVIQRPGTPVYSREDMANGMDDSRKAEILKRGYDLYHTYYDEELLTMEIYMDAYCIIYIDGIVKTIE